MKLEFISLDNTDRTVTVAIDGVRYEYWLGDRCYDTAQRVRKMLRKGAHGQALNFLKYRAIKTDRV